jgi:pyruvate kinase
MVVKKGAVIHLMDGAITMEVTKVEPGKQVEVSERL